MNAEDRTTYRQRHADGDEAAEDAVFGFGADEWRPEQEGDDSAD